MAFSTTVQISLHEFRPESLVQLLVDAVSLQYNVNGVESIDLAADFCAKTTKLLREQRLHPVSLTSKDIKSNVSFHFGKCSWGDDGMRNGVVPWLI
jgi:hypothetical protein